MVNKNTTRSYEEILFDFVLNTNKYLTECNDKDVISFDSDKWLSIRKLKDTIRKAFARSGIKSIRTDISNNSDCKSSYLWFLKGEECEILRAGSKGWQKGKVKINVTLEFIPDESEEIKSPLDDIRQETIESNKE